MTFNSIGSLSGFRVKRYKFGIGSLLFLLIFGGVFATAGGVGLKSAKINPSWAKISGTVATYDTSYDSDGHALYAPVVQYEVNTKDYRVTSNLSSSSQPHLGEAREVAYNPLQPSEAKIVTDISGTWFLYLFPAVGGSLMLLAPILFIRSIKRTHSINRLIQSGQKLQGVVVEVQSQGTNNNTMYKIVVSATDMSGQVQNYVSDAVGGVAGIAMADFRSTPIPIDVYVDPVNPQNYYVDISDIPNLTPDRIAELLKTAAANSQPHSLNPGGPPPK